MTRLLAAGWRQVSLVDVLGEPSFTLWLCGCNLRCPFCHNWRVAERLACRPVGVGEVVRELGEVSQIVSYLHVSGGEPLLQWEPLAELFEGARRLGVQTSLNTNCTLVGPLEKLLSRGLVDHLAVDLKAPFDLLSGLEGRAAGRLWRLYLDCLAAASRHGVPVELRIPVPANVDGYLEALERALGEASERLEGTEWYAVVYPIVGPPYVEPRDRGWCRAHCGPGREEVARAALVVRRYAGRVHVLWMG